LITTQELVDKRWKGTYSVSSACRFVSAQNKCTRSIDMLLLPAIASSQIW
jgi:hypothetical protein